MGFLHLRHGRNRGLFRLLNHGSGGILHVLQCAGEIEAAFVINELIKPTSVIPSHANELATKDGKAVVGSKTETFMKAAKVPVHLPLSGRTMEFDDSGKCVAGC